MGQKNILPQVRRNICAGVIRYKTVKELIDFLQTQLDWLKANKEKLQ